MDELSPEELDRTVAGLERVHVAEPAAIYLVSEPPPDAPPAVPEDWSGDFLAAWTGVQARFVDDPVGSRGGARAGAGGRPPVSRRRHRRISGGWTVGGPTPPPRRCGRR